MANNLGGAAKKFPARLDKIIEAEAKTSFLNMNSDLVGELKGNGEVEIAKIAMDGLGDYEPWAFPPEASRSTGKP